MIVISKILLQSHTMPLSKSHRVSPNSFHFLLPCTKSQPVSNDFILVQLLISGIETRHCQNDCFTLLSRTFDRQREALNVTTTRQCRKAELWARSAYRSPPAIQSGDGSERPPDLSAGQCTDVCHVRGDCLIADSFRL